MYYDLAFTTSKTIFTYFTPKRSETDTQINTQSEKKVLIL